MKILGLCTMGNSSAALIEDGKVIFATEEERLTRIKNDGSFPLQSIQAALDFSGIQLSDIDLICVYWERWNLLPRLSGVVAGVMNNPKTLGSKLNRIKSIFLQSNGNEAKETHNQGSWKDLFFVNSILRKEFGDFSAKTVFLDHHSCHIASAFEISGFDKSMILSYDGGGEGLSTLLGHQSGNVFTEILKERWPNSLGHYYSAFTGYLGFQMLEGEYKMMGLAPYGEPIYKDIILGKILQKKENGHYLLNTRILDYHQALEGKFSRELIQLFGAPRGKTDEFTQEHRNIAASVQTAYEEIVNHMISYGVKQFPDTKNICIVGGCGLNVTANGNIVDHLGFEKVFVPPAPHDAGCSVGAGILGHKKFGNTNGTVEMATAYLGQSFTNEQIEKFLVENNYEVPEKYDEENLFKFVSQKIADGNVIAWFQGRAEFGPRALGNRSFLADPRNKNIQDLMNEKIKKRELFRPFAPSVKEECAADFFEIKQKSPFMNIVSKVKEDKKEVIPAVTHIDGTARVHTVSEESNYRYWHLIDEFEKITGVGLLLNTSFNIQEPIINTPKEAVTAFVNSGVDYLVLNDYVLDVAWKEAQK
jgi:carbamoyltransferase